MPSLNQPGIAGLGAEHVATGQIIANGEFRGTARWLTCRYESDAPRRGVSPEPVAGIDAASEDPRSGQDGLGALLDAISHEVHSHAAAARYGVLADFSARVAHARKHQSPQLLAATLAVIAQQRKAALALISRNEAIELFGRKKAAKETLRPSEAKRGKSLRKPNNSPTAQPPMS